MNRWPLHKAYFWERIPFFRLLIPVVVAIVCYDQRWVPALSPNDITGIAAVSLAIAISLLWAKSTKQVFSILSFTCINILLFCIGWALCYQNDVRNSQQWFGHQTIAANAFAARITEAPAEKEKTWKLNVQVIDAINNGTITKTTGQAFVYVYKDEQPINFHKGDTIIIPNKWQLVKNAGNPFEFDYARYCARNNLLYQSFLPVKDIALFAKGNPADLSLTEKAHNWSMDQLATYISDSAAKGLIQAMLLGDEVNLDNNLLQAYSETGIVHIIAISGANVTIFFLVISFLLWWLKDNKYLWVKYMIALPIVWFYVLMAGAPPSAIRAAAMFTILAVGFALQKNQNTLNTLFAAATILLLAQPMWLFSVGFQLSFTAVLSILIFYQPLYRLYIPSHKITRALWATIVASVAAEVLVAPLVIYYFHLFPLLFIIANVVAYLFMGIVLILGMFIVVFSFIPFMAKFLAFITIHLVTWFDKIVYYLQRLNPVSFHYLRLSSAELILLYIIISGIAVFLLQKKKAGLFLAMSITCVLLLSFCWNEWVELHQDRLVVYNTGKGNYIELIHGKSHGIVYTDSITENKKIYATKPAHTYWSAWQERKIDTTNEVLYIGNKTVLILKQPIYNNTSFPVDYLIVCHKETANDISQVQQIFHPKMTILGNNYTRRQLETLEMLYKQQNIPLHSIANEGAFIVDAH